MSHPRFSAVAGLFPLALLAALGLPAAAPAAPQGAKAPAAKSQPKAPAASGARPGAKAGSRAKAGAKAAPKKAAPRLPFVEGDYLRALADARARNVPLVVDVWAPW